MSISHLAAVLTCGIVVAAGCRDKPAAPPATKPAPAENPPIDSGKLELPALPLAGSGECEPLHADWTPPRVRIVADAAHTCAWDSDGASWCWGENAAGQLGDGTREPRLTPVRSTPTLHSQQIDLGNVAEGGFSCALASDAKVYCWGANPGGQLGDGTTASRTDPLPVVGLSNVVEIAVGTYHACARTTSGPVRCWGEGTSCDLGDGQCQSRVTPVEVPGTENIVQLAIGISFSCGRTRDGGVTCWGGNAHGEVGVGTTIAVLQPTAVPGLSDVISLTASAFNPCAQVRDGRIYCWGGNKYGALGTGERADNVPNPIEVRDVPCGARLMPGAKCAVREDGRAFCWGVQLGDDNAMAHEAGAAALPIASVRAVFGYRTLFALTTHGELWGWGYNERGQLGDGTRTNRWKPVRIELPQ